MAKEKILNGSRLSELGDLLKETYIGEIVSLEGIEEQPGRVRIRVYGIFDSIDLGKIEDDDLPYSYPLFNLGFGSKDGGSQYSSPKVGTKVRVMFQNDIYHSRYFAPENLTPELQGMVNSDSVNFHSLMFDEDEKMRMFYSKKSGLLIDFDSSVINIRADKSIFINHKGNSATIELKESDIDVVCNNAVSISAPNNITSNSQLIHDNGSEYMAGTNPIFKMVNGDPLFVLLKGLATIINAKLPIDTAALELVNKMEDIVLSQTCSVTP